MTAYKNMNDIETLIDEFNDFIMFGEAAISLWRTPVDVANMYYDSITMVHPDMNESMKRLLIGGAIVALATDYSKR